MSPEQYLVFEPFRLDLINQCLWRGEQALTLTPKAFAVLRHLVAHSSRLVSKEELFQTAWPETVVSDAALKVCIGEIRKVLGDDHKTPRFVETLHRRGYRFLPTVTTTPPVVSSQ